MTKKVMLIAMGVMLLATSQAVAGEWYDKVKLGADLRYRHENIVKQKDRVVGTDVETYDEIRDRQRVRFRLKVEGKVNDNWKLKARLATGGLGTESTNQTLDGEYANKMFDLDQAYAEGKLFGVEDPIVTALLGKMSNPMVNPGKSQLLWDGDVTPEGVAAQFSYSIAAVEIFSNLGGFWLDERSKEIDSLCYSGQAGVKMKFGGIKLMVGGGLNAITDAYNTYGRNINVGEAFFEMGAKLVGQKVKLFGHYAQNGGAAGDEVVPQGSTSGDPETVDVSAMAFGAQFGKAKKAGSYQVKAMYKKYGNGYQFIWSDSDFAGGAMDSSGIVLAAAYAIWDNTTLGATYFINKYEDTNTGDYSSLEYNRLQIDLKVKY
ncbi:putative porin [bacterium]|nr:putative porin [bacterium]